MRVSEGSTSGLCPPCPHKNYSRVVVCWDAKPIVKEAVEEGVS